jgi:2Fe-2S ferredoxin
MTTVTFTCPDGTSRRIVADEGLSLMEVARRANVPGIIAECGGACSCATCHVYVSADWFDVVGEPDAMERDMLEFATGVQSTSRLSCQIRITPLLDGLKVGIPEE